MRRPRRFVSTLPLSFLELEPRITPVVGYKQLGDIEFYGDYTQVGTTYTFSGQGFDGDTVQLGYATNGDPAENFAPLMLIQGDVSFDLSAEKHIFTVGNGNAANSLAEVRTAPIGTFESLFVASGPQSINADDLVADGFRYDDAAIGPQTAKIGGVSLTINTFGIGLDPVAGTPTLEFRGSLLLGGTEKGLTVAINGPNFVYIEPDGTPNLTGAAVSFNDTFELRGIEIKVQNAGMLYDGQTSTFEVFGSVSESLPTDATTEVGSGTSKSGAEETKNTLTIGFGDATAPGIQVTNGEFVEISFAVTGEFELGRLQFKAEGLGMEYVAESDEYLIYGGASVGLTKGIQAGVELGTGTGNPGIVVKDGDWEVDDLALFLGSVGLGGFTLNDLRVSFAQEGGEIAYGGAVSVSFPGNWAVAGALSFVDGSLDDIALGLTFGEEGIPVFDTGVFLVAMGASVQNLDNPSNLIVSGSLSFDFGGQIAVKVNGSEKTVNLVRWNGTFSASADYLKLNAGIFFGALTTTTSNNQPVLDGSGLPSTQGYFGSATGTLDLDWGSRTYRGEVDASFIGGTVKAKAGFNLASDYTFTVYAGASLNVPDRVPLIGGDKLLSGTAVFQYDPTEKTAYLAAWADVLFVEAGFEYTLNGFDGDSNNFNLIGSDTIAAIQASVAAPQPQTYYYSYAATPPSGQTPNVATFKYAWPTPAGSQSVQVAIPNTGTVTLSPSQRTADLNVAGVGTLQVTLATDGTEWTVQVAYRDDAQLYASLPAGSYSLSLASTVQLAGVEFTPTFAYAPPTLVLTAATRTSTGYTFGYAGRAAAALASQVKVTLFVDRDGTGFDGTQIGQFQLPTGGAGSFAWNTATVQPGTYHVYAQIKELSSGTTFSEYLAQSVSVTSPLSGSVLDQNGALDEIAATVYVDLNGDGVFQQSEPSVQTAASDGGQFAFPNGTFQAGKSYAVNVSAPYGYVAPAPYTFTYNNAPLFTSFTLSRLNSVSGYVYSDDNGNGQRDPGEPGLSDGFSVSDGDTTATPSADGYYSFNSVVAPSELTVALTTPAGFTRTEGSGNYALPFDAGETTRTFTDTNFGVRRLATISGTVLGYRVNSAGVAASTATPVQGATVQLIDRATAAVAYTTTTDSSGHYSFTGLTPDKAYTVVQTPPAGWRQIGPQLPSAPSFNPVYRDLENFPSTSQGSIAIADFDRNGTVDIVRMTGDYGIAVMSGNTDGSFTTVANPGTFGAYGLNGNGLIVQAILVGGGVTGLLLVDDAGNVSGIRFNSLAVNNVQWTQLFKSTLATEGNLPFDQKYAAFGDLNSDGYDDYFQSLGQTTSSSHAGQYDYEYVLQAPQTDHFFYRFSESGLQAAIGDYNGDGVGEVAYATGSNTVRILNGIGSSIYVREINLPTGQPIAATGYSAAGDIDGDGRADYVWATRFGDDGDYNAISYTFNNSLQSNGSTLGASNLGTIELSNGSSRTTALLLRDFNGDFLPDILVVTLGTGDNQTQTAISIYTNTGTAPYFASTPTYSYQTGTYSQSQIFNIQPYDLDGNGLLDLVAYDIVRGEFLFLTNVTDAMPRGYAVTTSPTADTTGLDFVDGQIAATGTVGGVSYDDLNRNGAFDPGDLILANQTVFLDVNRNGLFDLHEPTRVTDANGLYAFTGLPAGEYAVGLLLPGDRLVAARGTAMHTVNLTADAGFGTADFGSYVSDPVVLVMPEGNGDDEWTAYRNGDRLEIRDDRTGVLVLNRKLSDLRSVTVIGSAGEANTLRIDLGQGDLTGAGLFSFRGGSGNDTLHLIGGPGDDDFDLTGTGGTAKNIRLGFSGLDHVRIDGLDGSDTIRLRPDAAVAFTLDGGDHGTPGDKLDLDLSQVTGVTRGEGVWTFTNARPVTYTGFESITPPPVVPPVVPAAPVGPALVTASGSRVVVTGYDGKVLQSFPAFEESFAGGVSVALGDVTGDGVADIVVGAGAGGGPRVRVFDGVSGAVLRDFFAFEVGFAGGVSVALGDVTGDGVADIVVGAGAGGGPRVRVFDGVSGAVLRDFFAFEPGFAGGVSVAVGDLNGDGFADIVVGAGVGGGPRVRAFSGRDTAVLADFFAYAPDATVGVNVAVGDFDGDGRVEIVTGAMTAAPHVAVFTAGGQARRSFFAFEPSAVGGVSVAVGDLTADGVADIVVGAGPGGGPRVRVFGGATEAVLRDDFAADESDRHGVTVGSIGGSTRSDQNGELDPAADFLGGVPVK